MHSLALVGTLALGSVASAAASCNPSYSVPSAGDCIKDCNQKAGTGLYEDWTNDPASPNFLKSLYYQCERGTEDYMTFMTNAGICMTACNKEQQAAFGKEFSAACQWYGEHKNDKCDGASGNGDPNVNPGAEGGNNGNGDPNANPGTEGGNNGNGDPNGNSGAEGGNNGNGDPNANPGTEGGNNGNGDANSNPGTDGGNNGNGDANVNP
ncbi:hypothetical protein DFQ30_010512, partial [Apophysomyces sp. BC1015]